MTHFKSSVFLGLLLIVILSGGQFRPVSAAETVSITNAMLLGPWENETRFIFRGHPAAVTLSFQSSHEGYPIQVHVTLTDCQNVPVTSITQTIVVVGTSDLTVHLSVPSYSFVGVGKYIIVVTDQNSKPLATLDAPIYIGILCDFNLDGKVNFSDLLNFVDAFAYYSQFNQVPTKYYGLCDINGDAKINFTDLLLFTRAYAAYYR